MQKKIFALLERVKSSELSAYPDLPLLLPFPPSTILGSPDVSVPICLFPHVSHWPHYESEYTSLCMPPVLLNS